MCALSISSDIDNASSVESFSAIMDYFNGTKETPFGMGLDLEVGNSFWFFNNSERTQLSYFDGLNRKRTELAPIIQQLWKSNHIDTIHSWGNFDKGSFERKYAEIGFRELDKYQIKIPIWINHGIGLNHQKVGNYPNMYGDSPNHSAYHLDYTFNVGCEYFWVGKTTHIIGQNSKPTLSVKAKQAIQYIMKRTKYKNVVDPIYDDGNELLTPIIFRDGTQAFEFTRFINSWGKEQVLDINDLSTQIKKSTINQLIKNEGFMVLYTHFNEHVKMSGLPYLLIKNLKYLKGKVDDGFIFMCTTSRLLKYKELLDYIRYTVLKSQKEIHIVIESEMGTPIGLKQIKYDQLQGLTFYTKFPEKTKIMFNNSFLKTEQNPKDETGEYSISIPWRKLEYPE